MPETSVDAETGRSDGWWARRSDPQRFDLYTRASLYFLLLCSPVMVLGALGSSETLRAGTATPLLVASLVHAVFAMVLLHHGLNHRTQRWPFPMSLLAVFGLLTVGVTVLAVVTMPDFGAASTGFLGVGLPVMLLVVVMSVARAPRTIVVMALATAALLAGLALLRGDVTTMIGVAIGTFATTAGFGFAFWSSKWMLDVVWGLDAARTAASQLAVAEERLRFSRDLRDVMGRNLSLIAVRAQVAEQLTRRGRDGAAAEIAQVREIAESSLREMREVVRGYRASDLTAEIDGARAVLRSAGIDAEVTIEEGSTALPTPVRTALAWVVREGTTNVIRHSAASWCRITVDRVPGGDEVRLTIANDGVAGGSASTSGSGLRGLAERVDGVGGALHWGPVPTDPTCFELRAEAPAGVSP